MLRDQIQTGRAHCASQRPEARTAARMSSLPSQVSLDDTPEDPHAVQAHQRTSVRLRPVREIVHDRPVPDGAPTLPHRWEAVLVQVLREAVRHQRRREGARTRSYGRKAVQVFVMRVGFYAEQHAQNAHEMSLVTEAIQHQHQLLRIHTKCRYIYTFIWFIYLFMVLSVVSILFYITRWSSMVCKQCRLWARNSKSLCSDVFRSVVSATPRFLEAFRDIGSSGLASRCRLCGGSINGALPCTVCISCVPRVCS